MNEWIDCTNISLKTARPSLEPAKLSPHTFFPSQGESFLKRNKEKKFFLFAANVKIARTLTISTLLFSAARWIGQRPSLLLALTASGLWESSHRTRSFRLERTASCKGRSPRTLRSHKLASCLARSFRVSSCPFAAPQWAGVRPFRSWRLGSAP